MITLGYDIGGTKIELIAYDSHLQKVFFKDRLPTERHRGYKHILKQIQKLFENFKGRHPKARLKGVGFALPGTVQNNVMIFGNTLVLKNKPLLKDLRKTFGKVKLVAENDANCFVYAEHFHGAGKKYSQKPSVSAVGFILGTGMGSGIIVNNQIFSGTRGAAGEIGHVPFALSESIFSKRNLVRTYFSRTCYCGQKNCAELFLSGPGFREYICTKYPSARGFSPKELLKKYSTTYKHFLALKIAAVVNTLDPAYIVLGGGLSTQPAIYKGLSQLVEPHLFVKKSPPPILKHKISDSAGSLGAALLATL